MSELPVPPTPEPLPAPPPMAVEPPMLAYAQVAAPRPGAITAVGVISIVLGSMSVVTNACGTLQPLSMMMLRSVQTRAATTSPVSPFAKLPVAPSVASAVLCVVELGLGVYLLTAGIMVMRNRGTARKHHLCFAKTKIPVAVVAAVASGWYQYEMQNAIFSNMQTVSPNAAPISFGMFPAWIALISTAFTFMLSIAYPVALLVVLSRPGIRGYFDALGD